MVIDKKGEHMRNASDIQRHTRRLVDNRCEEEEERQRNRSADAGQVDAHCAGGASHHEKHHERFPVRLTRVTGQPDRHRETNRYNKEKVERRERGGFL